MRWLALGAGAVMVTVAFLAGARVADTREGLIYEVISLFAGLAGVILILYGWVGASARAHPRAPSVPVKPPPPVRVRPANDLLIGAGGLAVVAILVVGAGVSNGILWALMALVLLLPMVIGCAYLCVRFFRAEERDWKLDLRALTRRR